MAMREDITRLKAVQSLVPAARTASANGTGVDTAGFESVACYASFGTITDGTHTFKIQDSPDNSTFTDVVAAQQIQAFAAGSSGGGNGSSTTQEVAYIGPQRYVRAVLTVAGATTGAVAEAFFILSRAHSEPA